MECRCSDMENCLNDILVMKEIVKEFLELEKSTQRLNENFNNISSVGRLMTYKEIQFMKEQEKINRKLFNKTPLIVNEFTVKIQELEKQYTIIMNEDNMFHNNTNI